MNAPAQVQPIPANTIPMNCAQVRGRVLEVKRSDSGVFTVITLPAVDNYSQPQIIEVRSKQLLGKPQDDISVRVQVGGYRRKYQDKRGDNAYATNLTLTAVE